jgi:hypothetical protein
MILSLPMLRTEISGMSAHAAALIAASQDMVGTGKVVRRERLGGLLSFYHREAA